jgi:hypothetical protein
MILWIKWTDSWSDSGWVSSERCKADIIYCESVGFLVDETKDAVVLAENRAASDGMKPYGDLIHIPKVAIIKRRQMRFK